MLHKQRSCLARVLHTVVVYFATGEVFRPQDTGSVNLRNLPPAYLRRIFTFRPTEILNASKFSISCTTPH
jgi:hypothetical protein